MRPSIALLVAAVPAAAQLQFVEDIKGIGSYEHSVQMKVELHRPAFLEWKSTHGKTYDSAEEEHERLMIWIRNHEYIEEHNGGDSSFALGHNQFSDLTNDEYQRQNFLGDYSKGLVRPRSILGVMANADDEEVSSMKRVLEDVTAWDDIDDDEGMVDKKDKPKPKPHNLPDSVNWLDVGAVTSVKNQGECGSCWAFSAIGSIEGARFIATGDLTDLSVQNMIDCDKEDLGCRGGLMDNAFKFDEDNDGVCSEAEYPYIAKQNTKCRSKRCTNVPGTLVKKYIDVPPGKKHALLMGIASQPVAIAVQASPWVFQFYKDGVLDDDSCGATAEIDHGVLAVGYATDDATGKDYWLVKNSWGDTWGDQGYLKIARDSKNEFGMCSILKLPSFPILA